MKIKKTFVFVGILLSAFCLFSCSQEGLNSEVINEDNVVASELKGITFSFIPPGKGSHIVNTRALHDNPEWAIDQLWLYEFGVDGKLIASVNIREESDFNQVGGLEARYTYKKNWNYGDQRKFFFVANMDQLPVTVGTTTLASLMETAEKVKQMATASTDILYAKKAVIGGNQIPVTDDNDWRIPMTGVVNNGNTVSIIGGLNLDVQLVRSVARIDVINRMPGFTITKMELFNSFKKSYLHNSWETPTFLDNTTNRLTTSVASFANLGAGVIGERAGVPIKKAFYLYEGQNVGAADADITYVKITAKFGAAGTEDEYVVPFKQKDAATGKFDTPVDVKRNHLYTIIVGSDQDAPDAKVRFTLVNEPWTVINMWEKFSFYNVKNHSGTSSLTNPAYNIVELTVPAAGGAVSVDFDTDYLVANNIVLSQAVPASDDWLTGVTITPGTKAFTVTFNVAANASTKVRNTLFKVKDSSLSADEDALIISVKQEAN